MSPRRRRIIGSAALGVALSVGIAWLVVRPRTWGYEFRITSVTRSGAESAVHRAEGSGWDVRARWPFKKADTSGIVARQTFTRDVRTRAGDPPVATLDAEALRLLRRGVRSARHEEIERPLGDGETIAGYPTRRYEMTEDDTLVQFLPGGRGETLRSRTVTVAWMTKRRGGLARRFARLADSLALLGAAVPASAVGGRAAARWPFYAGKGTPLKIVSTTTYVDATGRRWVTVTEAEVAALHAGR